MGLLIALDELRYCLLRWPYQMNDLHQMKRWQYLVLVLLILVWPPVYLTFISRFVVQGRNDSKSMSASDLQMLLNAKRWTFDVPEEQDGWLLRLEGRSDDKVYSSGGVSVLGGSHVTLVTRRNAADKKIDFAFRSQKDNAWSGGSGAIDDPIANAGVNAGRPEGPIKVGEPIYRGGRTEVQGFPGPDHAEFEVRVLLEAPNRDPG